jgi:hypothetical protein
MKTMFCEPCSALGEVEKSHEGIFQRAAKGRASLWTPEGCNNEAARFRNLGTGELVIAELFCNAPWKDVSGWQETFHSFAPLL